jgi:hypothetical protein
MTPLYAKLLHLRVKDATQLTVLWEKGGNEIKVRRG